MSRRPVQRLALTRTPVGLAMVALVALALVAPATASANRFRISCSSSHVGNDDPIVFPGQPGAAHRHEFFGARSTDAASTTVSLERSATSCAAPSDTAAYWTPTLEVRGILVRGTMLAYYERAGKARAAAPPRGLRMIAGRAKATEAQPLSVTSWQCVGRGRSRQFSAVPSCVRGERLAAWVRFPDCWNGRDLDSADHVSHMAYAARGACPSTHPVELMRVVFLVTWPVRPADPATVTLGNGMMSAVAMHGDFWNSWHQRVLRQLRWDCIEVAAPCGAITR